MTQLKGLNEPAAPDSIKATVMARIAREVHEREQREQRDTTARHLAPHGPLAAGLGWLWTAAGLALVTAAMAYGWWDAGSLPDLTSPRIGRGLASMVMAGPSAVLIGLGLMVYLTGLIAPLRDHRAGPRS